MNEIKKAAIQTIIDTEIKNFGKVLEKIGDEIGALSFEVRGNIKSFLLPQQSQHMDYIITEYERHRIQ